MKIINTFLQSGMVITAKYKWRLETHELNGQIYMKNGVFI